MTNDYDAVVIGGGPAGATCSLLLARAGWSVLLLERKAFPRRKVCGEYVSASNLPLLEVLGLRDRFLDQAGPEIRRVGLFAGSTVLCADLPQFVHPAGWGRALGREHLDLLLLTQAGSAGVEVRQPWTASWVRREGSALVGLAEESHGPARRPFRTPIVVAAHGSWERGCLPTQSQHRPPLPGDLFGFKAHFQGSTLSDDLMPLLAFPGGYGGMVHTDGGRLSVSLCLRRDVLTRIRAGRTLSSAGEAVEGYLRESCLGANEILKGSRREGPWLSAGPLWFGERLHQPLGFFPVGNAAGEAHPVIAEGITMAMQSAWLLANHLQHWRRAGRKRGCLPTVAGDYAAAWIRSFRPRAWRLWLWLTGPCGRLSSVVFFP